jgi:hypothetical protein
LDYIFELSDGIDPVLQPNVILAGHAEPANGGFFMLKPNSAGMDHVSRIVEAKVESLKNSSKEFDSLLGWGHTILPPDSWECNKAKGHNWTFFAPHSDQGLLYYYTKYVVQNISIILSDRIQRWQSNLFTGEPELVEQLNITEHKHPFSGRDAPVYGFNPRSFQCFKWTGGNKKGCPAPYSNFFHFTGRKKPWLNGPTPDWQNGKNSTPLDLWWSTLSSLNDELELGIADQLKNWTKDMRGPLLGFQPSIKETKHATIRFD